MLYILIVLYQIMKHYKLFHSLCDLISYELFFWNDLLSDCLSEASCCSSVEKTVNV